MRALGTSLFAIAALVAVGLSGCFQPAPAGATASDVQWTTYTDPGEHAFTVEAPAGWQVAGGMQRIAASDPREGVVMRSPDGAIQLFFGDPSLPVFVAPNPMLASFGLRTGMTYTPGPGFKLFIADFVPGQQFAAQWGQFRTSQVCGQVALAASRALGSLTDAVDAPYRAANLAGATAAGDAEFDCVLPSGAPGKAYALTATHYTTGSMTLWNVASTAGFVAPANRAGEARALLAHVIESYRPDPTWLAHQPGLPAHYAELLVQMNGAVSRQIADASPDTAVALAQAGPPPAAAPTETPVSQETPPPSAPPADAPSGPPAASYPAPNYAPPPMASASGAPPMDMSWAIQSQMANQAAGDAAAMNAFNRAYAMLAQARAEGHPFNGTLVMGNNPNTFGDGGYADRSNRTMRAIDDHELRATRGCDRVYEDGQGNRWYTC